MPAGLAGPLLLALDLLAEAGSGPSRGADASLWETLVPVLTSIIGVLGALLAAQVASARKARKSRAEEGRACV